MKVTKIQVIDEREGSEVPFLRGILTRSLRRAGLSFEAAYRVSNEIRIRLGEEGQITSGDLRIMVGEYLRRNGYPVEAAQYAERTDMENLIQIRGRDGTESPFSKGRLAQSMEICALTQESAFAITSGIEQKLINSGARQLTSTEIEQYTCDAIAAHQGMEIAERYRKWLDFSRSGRPLILLVGGTTGSGKSTMSSELAHRLNIVRTQSTDMLREVMRLMIPARLIPTLHTSTFEAYTVLPHVAEEDSPVGEPTMIAGYLSQAEQVGVGIEGVLLRVENEQVSLILEGVHIHPDLQHQIARNTGALVVPIILAVLKKKRLRKHLIGRGQQATSRRSERYLEHFNQIWELQSFLLSEADRFNVPIIINESEDETIRLIMQTISEYLAFDQA